MAGAHTDVLCTPLFNVHAPMTCVCSVFPVASVCAPTNCLYTCKICAIQIVYICVYRHWGKAHSLINEDKRLTSTTFLVDGYTHIHGKRPWVKVTQLHEVF